MSNKFTGKDYASLTDSTKKKLSQVLEKVHKSGFKISDYQSMNDKDFAKYLGIRLGKKTKHGYSNVYSHRRLLRQVKGTSERKKGSIDKALIQYKKQGWQGKGLDKMRRELVKTAGATFFEVYDELDKHYKFKNKTEGYEHTRQLLKVPQSSIDDLNDYDKEVIEGYDTSP